MIIIVSALLLFFCTNIFCKNVDEYDSPLILTPLIENGECEKARYLSKVDPSLFAGLESNSAFITVSKTSLSHLFFWFFPVENKPLEITPWIIWLQGGPGVSSLFGAFNEIGPLQFVNQTVQRKPVTWASDYSLLFIDNPAGAGFSLTENQQYVTNEDEVGSSLLTFIQQFLMVFPELRQAPLFITGESYAGKYIPAFGHYIHNNKNDLQPINLKGVAIGNGFIDPVSLLQYSLFGLEIGVLDPEQAAIIEATENTAKQAYKDGDMKTYRREWSHAITYFREFSGLQNPYNYAYDEYPDSQYVKFLNMNEVQDSLHVGRTIFSEMSWMVYSSLSSDFPLSVKPWLEELLENNYGVMCYNGQLDILVPYALSVNLYQSLQWSGAKGYKKAPRWLYSGTNKQPQMYIKQYANFVDAMIRGAGHITSYDQPQTTKDLIKFFIYKFHS